MKNIKLGHALSFYMYRKKIHKKKIKKLLLFSKAISIFESPLCIWQFECSVHIFRGLWLEVYGNNGCGVFKGGMQNLKGFEF